MKNISLIYGNENYLINEKMSELIKEIDTENIVKYNMETDSLDDALLDVQTVSMFDEKKIVICDNCKFLTREVKKNIEQNTDELLKYIENPFNDVYLFLIVRNEKLDSVKKIVKNLQKKSTVIELNKIENYNLNNYVLNYIKEKGYNISSSSISLLIEKASFNLSNILNEVDKLLIYKNEDKNITKDDIENVITNNIENDIFKLTNMITENKKDNIIKIYKDLVRSKEDPIKILITISNQLRLILQVKLMLKSGYTDNEMISILKEHPYRIKIAKNCSLTEKKLKQKLEELSKLDYDIVTGKVEKEFGLEMFLLNV